MKRFYGPVERLYHGPHTASYCPHERSDDPADWDCSCRYCDFCGDPVEGCIHDIPGVIEREIREYEAEFGQMPR